MLKIDVIKFETQDVITTSIPDMNVVPEGAPVNPTCYCDESCRTSDGLASHEHGEHKECTKCEYF
jgi:hypothetical protein